MPRETCHAQKQMLRGWPKSAEESQAAGADKLLPAVTLPAPALYLWLQIDNLRAKLAGPG